MTIGGEIVYGVAGIQVLRVVLTLLPGPRQIYRCVERLDLAEVHIYLNTFIYADAGIAYHACCRPVWCGAGWIAVVYCRRLSGSDYQTCILIVVVHVVHLILCQVTEAVGCLVAIGGDAQLMISWQLDIHSCLYLCGSGVLQILGVFHVVNESMVVQQLCCCIVLGHIAGSHVVAVVLVGIEIVESWGFRVQSDASSQAEPVGKFECQVQTR